MDICIDKSEIGGKLREARRAKKLTQSEVSQVMDFGVTFYSNIERGKCLVNLTRLLQLCELYEVKPGVILNQCTPGIRKIKQDTESQLDTVSAEIMDAVHRCSPRAREIILQQIKALEEHGV